jgi:hypothetical protein
VAWADAGTPLTATSATIADDQRMRYRRAVALILLLLPAQPALAQKYTAAADLLFYGDNTEFANQFREGETILGVSGTIFLDIAISDAVTVRGGLFASGRFGSHEFVEQGEPLVALEVRNKASRFIFGSLETVQARHEVAGPDRETLHGLLPPIQDERLTFRRGQEMGLQWIVAAPRVAHDVWINWQRLNTSEHRERFDTGYRGQFGLASTLQLIGQWHLVHEGGQQFNSGAVSDSQAGAAGLEWTQTLGRSRLTLDGHAVGTRYVPDREQPDLIEGGLGVFARGAVDRGPWRAHLIVWRSNDTLKDEGDPNYLAVRTDGRLWRKTRDYGEVGLTRRFAPAPGVDMFAAFRLHRVESHYEYSYRIVGRVRLRHPF